MIFHVSIDADNPAVVAETLARIWRCQAYPFPPVGVGSWVVASEDQFNTTIEVYPRGLELQPGGAGAEAQPRMVDQPAERSAHHFATSTRLSEQEVYAITDDAGWPAQRLSRGGLFDVIEVWIEGRIMIEVLTPQMQRQYIAAQIPAPWKAASRAAA